MTKIIPFTVDHLRVAGRIRNDQEFRRILENHPDTLDRFEQSGTAYSCFVDGLFVAAAGLYHNFAGNIEIWLWAAESLNGHRLTFHRVMKKAMANLAAKYPGQMVVAHVDIEDDSALSWMESLGFCPRESIYLFPCGAIDKIKYIRWERRL